MYFTSGELPPSPKDILPFRQNGITQSEKLYCQISQKKNINKLSRFKNNTNETRILKQQIPKNSTKRNFSLDIPGNQKDLNLFSNTKFKRSKCDNELELLNDEFNVVENTQTLIKKSYSTKVDQNLLNTSNDQNRHALQVKTNHDKVTLEPIYINFSDTSINNILSSTKFDLDIEPSNTIKSVKENNLKIESNNFNCYNGAKEIKSTIDQLCSIENRNDHVISASKFNNENQKPIDIQINLTNTQILKDINDVIIPSNQLILSSDQSKLKISRTPLDNIFNILQSIDEDKEKVKKQFLKRKSSESWDDSINDTIFKDFRTSQMKKDAEDAFSKLEQSLCDTKIQSVTNIGNDNKYILNEEDIVNAIENTFKNPHLMKQVLEDTQNKIRIASQVDWSDNMTLNEALINLSMEGQGLGDLIKKRLIENVKKTVSPAKGTNRSLSESTERDYIVQGSFYGLPETVKRLLILYRGIQNLYEWQDECLKLPAVQNRRNLVYALPTSGGKTLVAEILILRELLCRRKNVIFVLPYVAIVQEKIWSLSPFAVALDFLIEEYAGGKGLYPPRKRRRKNSVYICTIEKALGVLNSLVETKRVDEIGLVVVDELHLLGDESRGPTLEAFLTKINILKENIQVIGMSATIGNIDDICKFLKADVYQREFRPVELIEYVKCNDELARINSNASSLDDLFKFERKLRFKYSDALLKIDPDMLGGLVMEVIPEGSCLVFCRSKQNCENVALLLCRAVLESLKNHKKEEKEALKRALADESGTLCNTLNISVSYGIAYHHSGLTSEERRIIEEGFRSGVISVICCTSTLAAGVNLPAKRVIIRNPYIGLNFLNLSRYKQMVGRAGRAGLGDKGESILICTPDELIRAKELFYSPMDVAKSHLQDNDGRGLQNLLLSCVSLGLATTKREMLSVADETLMSTQKDLLITDKRQLVRDAIRILFQMGSLQVDGHEVAGTSSNLSASLDKTNALIDSCNLTTFTKTKINITNDSKLVISKMGTAAIKSGLDLVRAHLLYDDLISAQTNLVLLTGLHLMYLVTPYDISDQIKPPKSNYYTLYTKLNQRDVHTASVVGLTEAIAIKLLTNKKITEIPERVLNRFYVTLMLNDLWNEMPVYDVSIKYGINRGMVQNLMAAAASFASNVYHFCEVFQEFWTFSLLIKGMSERLAHCCIKELEPLMVLPAVKQNRAKQLYQAGYKTLPSIAKANPQELIDKIEYMTRRLANQLIAAAKLIILERVENLREEAEDVLEGVVIT